MAFFFQEFDEWLDKVETSIDSTKEGSNYFKIKVVLI